MHVQPRHLFLPVIAVLLVVAAGLAVPFFTLTELIYPVRHDSLYYRAVQLDYGKEVRRGAAEPGRVFLFHPSEIGLAAADVVVRTPDSIDLRGWIMADSASAGAIVVFLSDIGESRYDYIVPASELVARGLSVCLFDLRMQGESGGNRYAFGETSVQDVLLLVDTLRNRYGIRSMVLFGNGTGAAIALRAGLDTAVSVVVAQNPYTSLDRYLGDFADAKYGWLSRLFLGRMKVNFERKTGIVIDSVDIGASVHGLIDPVLFVSYLSEEHLDYKSTGVLYERCASVRKEWIVFRKDHVEASPPERKNYYDRIAAFIQVNLPKEKKKVRYRKLVYRLPGGR